MQGVDGHFIAQEKMMNSIVNKVEARLLRGWKDSIEKDDFMAFWMAFMIGMFFGGLCVVLSIIIARAALRKKRRY